MKKGIRRILRLAATSGSVSESISAFAPFDGRAGSQTERGLEVNVHATREVGSVDNVNVVGRVGTGGRHGRGLHDTLPSLPVTVDGLVDQVADGHLGTFVRVHGVNITALESGSSIG